MKIIRPYKISKDHLYWKDSFNQIQLKRYSRNSAEYCYINNKRYSTNEKYYFTKDPFNFVVKIKGNMEVMKPASLIVKTFVKGFEESHMMEVKRILNINSLKYDYYEDHIEVVDIYSKRLVSIDSKNIYVKFKNERGYSFYKKSFSFNNLKDSLYDHNFNQERFDNIKKHLGVKRKFIKNIIM